jgi:hypothetical protein
MYVEYIFRKLNGQKIFNLESEHTNVKKTFYLHSIKDSNLFDSKNIFLNVYNRLFTNLYDKRGLKKIYIDLETHYACFLRNTKANMMLGIHIDTKKKGLSQIKKLWPTKFDFVYPLCFNFKNISKKKSPQFFLEKINIKSKNNHINLNCMFLKRI